MKRRGMSQIITTVIMIGIVLVAIGAVWVVAQNILSEGLEDVSLGSLKVNLDIENVKVTDTGIDVKVKRNSGEANLVGINFIVSDGMNSEVFEEETNMKELATQTFSLDYDGAPKSVEIAPVLANDEGKEKVYDVIKKLDSDYEISCLDLLENKNTKESGIYDIDFDGLGEEKPVKAYCDMTTDGGGWTLVARSLQGSSGAMGWMVSVGEVEDTDSYFSLGEPYISNLHFSELLLGKEKSNSPYELVRDSSTNLAKFSDIPDNFLEDYSASTLYVAGNIEDLNNGPTVYGAQAWNGMMRYVGYTNNESTYFFRDTSNPDYVFGINSNRFLTCYNTGNFCDGSTSCSCYSSVNNTLLFVR